MTDTATRQRVTRVWRYRVRRTITVARRQMRPSAAAPPDVIVNLADALGLELVAWLPKRGALDDPASVEAQIYHAPIPQIGRERVLLVPDNRGPLSAKWPDHTLG